MAIPKSGDEQRRRIKLEEHSSADRKLASRKEQLNSSREKLTQALESLSGLQAEYQQLLSADPSQKQAQQKYLDSVITEARNISEAQPSARDPKSVDEADILIKAYGRLNNAIKKASHELEAKIDGEKQAQQESEAKQAAVTEITQPLNIETLPTVSASASSQNTNDRDIAKQVFKKTCKEFMSVREETIGRINNLSNPETKDPLNNFVNNLHDSYTQLLEQAIKRSTPASSKEFQEWTEVVKQYTAEMNSIRNEATKIAQTAAVPLPAAVVPDDKHAISTAENNLINSRNNFLEARRQLLETIKKLPRSPERSELIQQGLAITKKYDSLGEHIKSKPSAADSDHSRWEKFVKRYTTELQAINTKANQLLAPSSPTETQQQTSSAAASATTTHESSVITSDDSHPTQKSVLADITSPLGERQLIGAQKQFAIRQDARRKPSRKAATRSDSSTEQNDDARIEQCREKLQQIETKILDMRTAIDNIDSSLFIERDRAQLNQLIGQVNLNHQHAVEQITKLTSTDKKIAILPIRREAVLTALEKEVSELEEAATRSNTAITQRQAELATAESQQDSNPALAAGNTKRYQEVQQLYQEYTEMAERYSQALDSLEDTQQKATLAKAFNLYRTQFTKDFTELKQAYDPDPRNLDLILHRKLSKQLPDETARLTTELTQLETAIATPTESQNPQRQSMSFEDLSKLTEGIGEAVPESDNELNALLKQFTEGSSDVDELDKLFGELQEERAGASVAAAIPSTPESGSTDASNLASDVDQEGIDMLDELLPEGHKDKQAKASDAPAKTGDINAAISDLDDLFEDLQKEKINPFVERVEQAHRDFLTASNNLKTLYESQQNIPLLKAIQSEEQALQRQIDEFNKKITAPKIDNTTKETLTQQVVSTIKDHTWIVESAHQVAAKQATTASHTTPPSKSDTSILSKLLEDLDDMQTPTPTRSSLQNKSDDLDIDDVLREIERKEKDRNAAPAQQSRGPSASAATSATSGNPQSSSPPDDPAILIRQLPTPPPSKPSPLPPNQVSPQPQRRSEVTQAENREENTKKATRVPNWMKSAWNRFTSILPAFMKRGTTSPGSIPRTQSEPPPPPSSTPGQIARSFDISAMPVHRSDPGHTSSTANVLGTIFNPSALDSHTRESSTPSASSSHTSSGIPIVTVPLPTPLPSPTSSPRGSFASSSATGSPRSSIDTASSVSPPSERGGEVPPTSNKGP